MASIYLIEEGTFSDADWNWGDYEWTLFDGHGYYTSREAAEASVERLNDLYQGRVYRTYAHDIERKQALWDKAAVNYQEALAAIREKGLNDAVVNGAKPHGSRPADPKSKEDFLDMSGGPYNALFRGPRYRLLEIAEERV
jgi:hypothetical protein